MIDNKANNKDTELYSNVRELASSPYFAVPKICLDVVLWCVVTVIAIAMCNTWATLLAIALIGAIPMHDILVHGHDSTHRLVSRLRRLNDFFLWFNHAIVGISGTAYRAFHMDHHRHAHTKDDPEYRLLHRLSGGKGWGYLLIPFIGHIAIYAYPFYTRHNAKIRLKVIRDLICMIALHVGACTILSPTIYLTYLVTPIFTSLAAVVILRSVCEHHGTDPANIWTNTRTMKITQILAFLWSNTNYHLEHHLFPSVPFHKMPELRNLLEAEHANKNIAQGHGYIQTALKLLIEPKHFKEKYNENI